jgi:acyl-coenzyme A synthetase/AMP-(fatty) acid ligase
VADDAHARPHRPALGRRGRHSAHLTYAELHAEVNRCANALRSLGLGKGDAVGLYMPMIPELAIAFLAIIKIGGIILPLFSGYGHGALVARLADAGAKAVSPPMALSPRRGGADEADAWTPRAKMSPASRT